jgi:uncharacterized repeat protein (TIGR03847 family)
VFDAQHVFGPATRLQAQALGEPGQRTFRLLVESDDGGAAVLWLEKEQLQALGLAVEQLLAELQGRLASAARTVSQPPQESFPDQPAVDIKVGRLALGQDESELETGPRYVLLAYDLETMNPEESEEPSSPPTFAVRATRDQLRALSRNIAEVVAAGRPRCPLCGEPVQQLGQPHGCVRANGHRA